MYFSPACWVPGCRSAAVFRRTSCFRHLDDPEAYVQEVYAHLAGESRFRGLELSEVPLAGLDLSGKEFHECSFSRSQVSHCGLEGVRFSFVFMDFAILNDCRVLKSDMRSSVFAGSQISHCAFDGSDILRCSFVGVQCRDSSFSGSDLYEAHFGNATFETVSFRDCNLKRARYERVILKQVDFRYSNPEEAVFHDE